MTSTIRDCSAKIAVGIAAFACAMMLALICAGAANATTMSVKFTVPGDTTPTEELVTIDNLTNSSTDGMVYGQFYKSGAWTVLATGAAAGQYATFTKVLQNAIDQYNNGVEEEDEIAISNVWNSSKKLSLTATDGAYTKYYPSYADINGRKSFFGTADNGTTSFSGLTATHTNGDAVFALSYGSAIVGTGSNCSAAAASAASSITTVTSGYPRLIMGCDADMTSSTAMGKRYCFDITGFEIVAANES